MLVAQWGHPLGDPRHIGEAVTLWYEGLSMEEVTRCAFTISYQLLWDVT